MAEKRQLPSAEEALRNLERSADKVTMRDLLDAFLAKMNETGHLGGTLTFCVNGVLMQLSLRVLGIDGQSVAEFGGLTAPGSNRVQ